MGTVLTNPSDVAVRSEETVNSEGKSVADKSVVTNRLVGLSTAAVSVIKDIEPVGVGDTSTETPVKPVSDPSSCPASESVSKLPMLNKLVGLPSAIGGMLKETVATSPKTSVSTSAT